MDFKQLEYITTIAREENITKAAQKLYITRSALNYSLLNIEKQLGFPLFKRMGNKLIPTYGGEVFLKQAEQILASCHELDHSMLALSDAGKRRISLGITVGGGQRIFEDIFPVFHREYPDISIHLLEGSHPTLESALLKGQIDLAWASNSLDNPQLEYVPIRETVPLCLAVPKSHPCVERLGIAEKNGKILDLSLFKEERFILMNRSTFIRKRTDEMFHYASFKPHILLECSQMAMVTHFISEGIGLGFVPESFREVENFAYFYKLEPQQMLESSIMFRTGTTLTAPEKRMIELVTARGRKKPD